MTLLLPLLRPLNIDSHQLPFWRVPPSTPADVKDARLYGRLLTNMTAKTVSQRTDASTRHVSSLHGPLSKHAGYFLLQYLRACTLSPAPLSLPTRTELSAGIYEVIGTMGKYERDSLMNSLLAPKDEAERMLLRSLWKDYERTRYKGQA